MNFGRAALIAGLTLLSVHHRASGSDVRHSLDSANRVAASKIRTPSSPVTTSPSRSEAKAPVGGRSWMSEMSWQTLRIGAGGFITGLDIATDGTKVVRTDVYGAYIYDAAANAWQQIVTVSSMPATSVDVGSGQGVYEIAIAPNNSQRLYMVFDGAVFRSDDRGAHWKRTSFVREKRANPNDGYRTFGRKMAIDPANADIIYVGSPGGLFVSEDGGASWSIVLNVQSPSPQEAGVLVAFDPTSGVVNGRTQRLYASSYGKGIFQTTDGGTIWTLTTNTPTTHMHLFVDKDTSVWLVDDINRNQGAGNLYKYTGNKWFRISPINLAQSITVDPKDAKHVVVLNFDGRLMISQDAGSTWQGPTAIGAIATDIPWIAATNTSVFSSADIRFDPSERNEIYNVTGIGVFHTDAPSKNGTVIWTSQSRGIEELVSTWIVSPPGGAPILTAWDRPVFRVDDPEAYPKGHGINYANEIVRGASADWASTAPNIIVVIANNFAPTPASMLDTSGYSLDGGRSWTVFGSNAPYSMNRTSGGCIAASTSKNFLWAPTDGAGTNYPWYTNDGGNSWQASIIAGVPQRAPTGWGFNFYLNRQICAADRINVSTFYLYNDGSGSSTAAGIYKSIDGGTSWSHVYKRTFPNAGYSAQMRSVPGKAGNLFFSAGAQSPPHPSTNEFYRSTDGGTTWSAINGVREVQSFGFGKAVKDGSYPAVYLSGWVSIGSEYKYGVWRSTDNALSWTQIGDGYPTGSLSPIEAVEGDSNTFGIVYVGTTGNGWYYGKPN